MPTKDILLVTDADNTLWDTNAAYARAQLALLADVEDLVGVKTPEEDRLSLVRRLDEKIASGHPRWWKYPPSLLVGELVQALLRSTQAKSERSTVSPRSRGKAEQLEKIAAHFQLRITQSCPNLRPGVKRSLAELKKIGARVVVATEEPPERCASILAHYQLSEKISEVASGHKTVQFFQAIMGRLGNTGQPSFSVGDQVDRDIAPAKLAGFTTILFPGGFRPTIREHQHIEPDFVVSSYTEVVQVVRRCLERHAPAETLAQ